MGLPALYYDGRANPPHPEIWLDYFLRMMELHANKTVELVSSSSEKQMVAGRSFLSVREKKFLDYLLEKKIAAFAPVDLARALKVSNRTVINWCAALVKNGFLVPDLSGQRIRSYSLTELAKL